MSITETKPTAQVPATWECEAQPNWDLIPLHMQAGLCRYIEHGIPTGDCWTAILCNDLQEAFARADDTVRDSMADIVRFIHNYAPVICCGSQSKVANWISLGGFRGWTRRADETPEGNDENYSTVADEIDQRMAA